MLERGRCGAPLEARETGDEAIGFVDVIVWSRMAWVELSLWAMPVAPRTADPRESRGCRLAKSACRSGGADIARKANSFDHDFVSEAAGGKMLRLIGRRCSFRNATSRTSRPASETNG